MKKLLALLLLLPLCALAADVPKKWQDYGPLVSSAANDTLLILDVSDTTDNAAGTVHQITRANLFSGFLPTTLAADTTIASIGKDLILYGAGTSGTTTDTTTLLMGLGGTTSGGYDWFNWNARSSDSATGKAAFSGLQAYNNRDGTDAFASISTGTAFTNTALNRNAVITLDGNTGEVLIQSDAGGAGLIKLTEYLNTRDDTGNPANVLSTDSSGNVRSHPVSQIAAGTAAALAANGANCSAGSFPLGVDASGAVESCTALSASNAGTATAFAADPADCSANNFATAINASGTLTCAQPSISAGVSGLGTGVATALGVNVGSAGAFVTNGGALGTPSSGTLTSATGLPTTGLAFYTAPTTADANADAVFGASTAAKKPFVIQTKANNTASAFEVQYSDGTCEFCVQRDGNVIVNQKFGNVASKPMVWQYQGIEQGYINYQGQGSFNGGLTVGGFFTVDTAGNISTKHIVAGTGTSPTVGGSCGSSPAIAGKDSALKVTTGTGSPTSCTVTFGTAWATAPVCNANAATTTTALNVTTTTTTVVVSAVALTASEVLHVVCVGF